MIQYIMFFLKPFWVGFCPFQLEDPKAYTLFNNLALQLNSLVIFCYKECLLLPPRWTADSFPKALKTYERLKGTWHPLTLIRIVIRNVI